MEEVEVIMVEAEDIMVEVEVEDIMVEEVAEAGVEPVVNRIAVSIALDNIAFQLVLSVFNNENLAVKKIESFKSLNKGFETLKSKELLFYCPLRQRTQLVSHKPTNNMNKEKWRMRPLVHWDGRFNS